MVARVHPIYAGMSWCYLVEGDGGMVLVDAGAPRNEDQILERLREIGRDDLRLIWITHAHLDHYGSAAAVRSATGAPVAIHEADAAAMARGETPLGSVRLWGHLVKALLPIAPRRLKPPPARADLVVGEGDSLETFGIAAEVLHTPGHTPGSTSLLVDGRHLFVGDLVSNMVWPHAQLLYAHDWVAIRASIRRLQALSPEWVYTGHGKRPMSGSHFARIKAR
jgi:glyoxylase-like metal-dependent hydrolase (beta-lactamase superfamily II)